jgi:NAD+ synthase (glutamine-hydrolysing)
MTEAEPFHWGPRRVLPEGRIEQNPAYLPAEAEYEQAATLGLYDYMRKSRSKGFCLSLSGGADSACCAILVHRMGQRLQELFNKNRKEVKQDLSYWPELVIELGKANSFQINKLLLACLYQSTENSSDTTRMAARAIAENIGCFYEEVDITPQLRQYTADAERIIGRKISWENDDLALQNIQARVRAPMIWYWTNLRGSLLLTTSNRSEGSVGYSTMDGDMAGGIAPIAGVSKDFVRSWLVFAEKELGYQGLSLVNALQPTAELRPLTMHQTDEKDLMPYALLDQIENLLISKKYSENEALSVLVLKGEYDAVYLKTCISRFITLWRRNQWKRERLAPSFHLDTYNIDPRTWCRYPILSGE